MSVYMGIYEYVLKGLSNIIVITPLPPIKSFNQSNGLPGKKTYSQSCSDTMSIMVHWEKTD